MRKARQSDWDRVPKNPKTPNILTSIDMNLLITLHAIIRRQSVSGAAEDLFVTQPAVSHALAKLRTLLKDQILVRGPQGMMLTDRAREIELPLKNILSAIEQQIFEARGFDPLTSQRTFTLAITDYAEGAILPEIVTAFAKAAPNCRLGVRALPGYTPVQQLASGAIDLCIAYRIEAQPGIKLQRLLNDRFVCIARRDHPLIGDTLSLKQYLTLKHAIVSPIVENPANEFQGIIDVQLELLGKSRNVTLSIPHFFLAPRIVANSDYVMTVAELVAHHYGRDEAIKILPVPIPMRTFETNLIWHERNDSDPGMIWLRRLIKKTTEALDPGVQE